MEKYKIEQLLIQYFKPISSNSKSVVVAHGHFEISNLGHDLYKG